MRRILAAIIICFFVPLAMAENPTPLPSNGESNAIGMGGTVFFTWGFMYRRHFANNLGFSTSLGGWFEKNGFLGNSLQLMYSVGVINFTQSKLPESTLRVYVQANLANIYDYNMQAYSSPPLPPKHTWQPGIGAGIGMEYFFNKHVSLHLELPWMTTFTFSDKKLAFKNSHPHVGGGLLFYF